MWLIGGMDIIARNASGPNRTTRSLRIAAGLIAPFLLGATSLTTNFEDRVLAAHNRERAGAGIAPLHWDADLARSAAAWADHLVQTADFAHAPARADKPEGENLWMGTRNRYSVEAMVDRWIAEKKYFRPGRFPDNSTTGQIGDVGHYTQVMWRQTGKVGCAVAADPTGDRDLLVCRYSDAGNYIGKVPF